MDILIVMFNLDLSTLGKQEVESFLRSCNPKLLFQEILYKRLIASIKRFQVRSEKIIDFGHILKALLEQ